MIYVLLHTIFVFFCKRTKFTVYWFVGDLRGKLFLSAMSNNVHSYCVDQHRPTQTNQSSRFVLKNLHFPTLTLFFDAWPALEQDPIIDFHEANRDKWERFCRRWLWPKYQSWHVFLLKKLQMRNLSHFTRNLSLLFACQQLGTNSHYSYAADPCYHNISSW